MPQFDDEFFNKKRAEEENDIKELFSSYITNIDLNKELNNDSI